MFCVGLVVATISLPLTIYESLENQVEHWAQTFPSDSFYVMLYPRKWAEQDAARRKQAIENLPLFAPPESNWLEEGTTSLETTGIGTWFTSERLDSIRQLPYVMTISWMRPFFGTFCTRGNEYNIILVSPDHFELAGLPLSQGRAPSDQDTAHTAVLGSEAHKMLFRDSNAIGESLIPEVGCYYNEPLTVSGVLAPAGNVYNLIAENINQSIYILDREPVDFSPNGPIVLSITEIWVKPETGRQSEAINAIRTYLQMEVGGDTLVYILTNKDYTRWVGGIQARQYYVPAMNWIIGLTALVATLNGGLVIYALLFQRRYRLGIRRVLGLTRGALVLEEIPSLLVKGIFASALGILIAASLAPFVGKAIQPVEFYIPVKVGLGIYTGLIGLATGTFVWCIIACLAMLIFLRRSPAALLRERHIAFGSRRGEKWLSGLGFAIGIFALMVILGLRDGTVRQFDRILGWAGGERAGTIVDWITTDTPFDEKPAELSTFDYALLKDALPDAAFGWLGRTSGLPGITVLEASASMEVIRPPVLATGRWISPEEEKEQIRVAVFGRELAARLAKERNIDIADLIGQTWESYQIIGVMDEWPARYSMGYRSDVAYVPIGAQDPEAEYYYPGGQIAFIVPAGMSMSEFLEKIHLVLDPHHPEGKPQFIFAAEKVSEMLAWRMRLYALMGLFAAVGLLIGSLGIMNLIFMWIVSRWREIGIRRALGATRSKIARMVLAQALQITLLATLVGGAIGTAIALVVQQRSGWPMTIYPYWLAVVAGIAVFSALIFGGLPALWAASRTPTEMLRME